MVGLAHIGARQHATQHPTLAMQALQRRTAAASSGDEEPALPEGTASSSASSGNDASAMTFASPVSFRLQAGFQTAASVRTQIATPVAEASTTQRPVAVHDSRETHKKEAQITQTDAASAEPDAVLKDQGADALVVGPTVAQGASLSKDAAGSPGEPVVSGQVAPDAGSKKSKVAGVATIGPSDAVVGEGAPVPQALTASDATLAVSATVQNNSARLHTDRELPADGAVHSTIQATSFQTVVENTHAGHASGARSASGAVVQTPSAAVPTPADALPVTTLTAGKNVLEIGIANDTHGWLRVRAELGAAGEISTSVTTSSAASAERLQEHIPAIAAYLSSEQLGVASVAVTAQGADANAQSASMSSSQRDAGQNGAQQNDRQDSAANDNAWAADVSSATLWSGGASTMFGAGGGAPAALYGQPSGSWLSVRV